MEAWPNDRIIRITSDYDSSLDMLKLFIRMIENVKVGVIDLYDSIEGSGANQREKLDDGVLRQVEEYTSTVIEPEKHRKEVSTEAFHFRIC